MNKYIYTFFLFLGDVVFYYVALVIAFLIRKFLSPFFGVPFDLEFSYVFTLWWIPAVILVTLSYEGMYSKRLPFLDEAQRLVKVLTIAFIIILAIVALGKISDEISRTMIIAIWLAGIVVFPLGRYAFKKLLFKFSIGLENVIIIGAGNAGIDTAKGIVNQPFLGYSVFGFLDDDPEKRDALITVSKCVFNVLGTISDFDAISSKHKIKTAMIAIPSLETDQLSSLINKVQKKMHRVIVVPELRGIALLNTELYHLFDQELFLLRIHNNLKSKSTQILKRIFDISLAILMMPFMFLTLMIIAILIKKDSHGPIFYRHLRTGKNGKDLYVWKFRSMYKDAKERLDEMLENDAEVKKEWETNFKLKNDPRITKVGRFLRKTSLDELPQFINVLIGNMSFVGPRPVVKEEIELYYKDYAEYYFEVTPGITGLWQVSGRSNTSYDFRVKTDAWYVLNWSFWLDIVILFKTVKVVLKREGAH